MSQDRGAPGARRGSIPVRLWGAAALLALVVVGCATDPLPAQAPGLGESHDYRAVTVVAGLEHPWGMAFLPGGDILVTERPGRLRLVRGGALDAQPIGGVPQVWSRGQGGLLDVALHPDFASNRMVYLSYSKPGTAGATTAVVRGRLDGHQLVDVQEVVETQAWGTGGQHFGSRLAFDRAGYLFITLGDRGQMQRAQDLSDHAGTTLRLHDDGRVPADNPFVGRSDALPEIFTYGNRNGQGLVIHPETNQVWQNEHGPRGGDEINLLLPGRNYGWPVITHGINYNGTPITDITHKDGMEQPVHYWVPSIATSGMAIYQGNAFPNWRGDFFVGGLAGQVLSRVRIDGTRVIGEERLFEGSGRVRDVRSGPDGFIYLLLDAGNGSMVRLEPAGE
jgi:aldose sugar dehydrogenase